MGNVNLNMVDFDNIKRDLVEWIENFPYDNDVLTWNSAINVLSNEQCDIYFCDLENRNKICTELLHHSTKIINQNIELYYDKETLGDWCGWKAAFGAVINTVQSVSYNDFFQLLKENSR